MKAINPTTGETLGTYPDHSLAEVAQRLERAEHGFENWRRSSFAERAKLLRAVAAVLRQRQAELAHLMTLEMGKPIAQSESEVEKCAWACDHFAEHAEQDLSVENVASDAARSFVRYDPLGPILAVMPWNFPLWQVIRAAAPALMAGNVLVLKHASNVPGCADGLERAFADAGAPTGVFQQVRIPGAGAEALVDHAAIRAVTLTGSEAAGMALGARAGRALKKTVLELGGSDPFLVLADADPMQAATQAAAARIINNGQSCIAAKRFIVERPLAERFERLLGQRMARLKVGDPLDRATELGPLARPDLVDALERQMRESIRAGARLVTGGARPERAGSFYAPTVLADVRPGMPAFDEETFGPLAAVIVAEDDQDAVHLANQSGFGLGASVWTSDPARGEALAQGLEAGSVFVNGIVKSDPRLPFGGVKRSGYGRELGLWGIREFVNVKTVWIGKTSGSPRDRIE
jgi:succinate-semialdehyde dehydrogenase/glutarate-semialdehyde dehydrogenase